MTSLEPSLATTRSGRPSPLRSWTVTPAGLVPAKKLRARAELAVAGAQVDQHVVAAAVGDDQVGPAVAVQVGACHGPGASTPSLAVLREALARLASTAPRRGPAPRCRRRSRRGRRR